MNITDIVNAMSGLDPLHLIITAVVVVFIARPDMAAKARGIFTRKPHTNGDNAANAAANAQATADAVREELRRHDDGCRESYKQVSRNFEKVFGILREHGKSIARIEGYLKGREEKAA